MKAYKRFSDHYGKQFYSVCYATKVFVWVVWHVCALMNTHLNMKIRKLRLCMKYCKNDKNYTTSTRIKIKEYREYILH